MFNSNNSTSIVSGFSGQFHFPIVNFRNINWVDSFNFVGVIYISLIKIIDSSESGLNRSAKPRLMIRRIFSSKFINLMIISLFF